MHVSLNSNELALPAPFLLNRTVLLQLISGKNICFDSDYHVYCAEIMCFKPYWFKLLM